MGWTILWIIIGAIALFTGYVFAKTKIKIVAAYQKREGIELNTKSLFWLMWIVGTLVFPLTLYRLIQTRKDNNDGN